MTEMLANTLFVLAILTWIFLVLKMILMKIRNEYGARHWPAWVVWMFL